MNVSTVRFPCGDISLEGALHLPQRKPALGGVVVCHPHPLYGGDMDNNVARAVCAGLENAGFNALRFNFRGVGDSEGSFANGAGEQEDVGAAVSFLSTVDGLDGKGIGLCGYSFGAGVAFAQACRDERVCALAAVSLQAPSAEGVGNYAGHKLLVCGSRDLLTPAHEVGSFAKTLSEPKEMVVVPDADHFWLGHEQRLASIVVDFFLRAFRDRAARRQADA